MSASACVSWTLDAFWMKHSRFREEQTIGILKQQEGGRTAADIKRCAAKKW